MAFKAWSDCWADGVWADTAWELEDDDIFVPGDLDTPPDRIAFSPAQLRLAEVVGGSRIALAPAQLRLASVVLGGSRLALVVASSRIAYVEAQNRTIEV